MDEFISLIDPVNNALRQKSQNVRDEPEKSKSQPVSTVHHGLTWYVSHV